MPTRSTWLAWAMEQASPLHRRWYSDAQLSANLSRQLDCDLDWLSQLGVKFERNMPVEGATPDMYNHRVCDVAGMQTMMGIRFRGRDRTQPFVDLVRANVAMTDASQIHAIADWVRDEFAVFKPLKVRFFQPSHLPFPVDHALVSGDKRVLAAALVDMLSGDKPVGHGRVTLQRVQSMEFYEPYAAAYAAIHRERPWLPSQAEAMAMDQAQDCIQTGFVFEVFVDGVWAGVIGAERRDNEFGLQGFVVTEMVLNSAARGQGLGCAVQVRLAEALQPLGEPSDLLYGTIGTENPPMLKTAQRAGRLDVGGYIWVSLNDEVRHPCAKTS